MPKQLAIAIGISLAAVAFQSLISPKKSEPHKVHKHHYRHQTEFTPKIALLGDVGGTNIRLQLVEIKPPHDCPLRELRKIEYLVSQEPSFQGALVRFLQGIPKGSQNYPVVAAVAMAGPVKNNKLSMANVRKWGEIDGDHLGKSLSIGEFRLMNDFEANTYGLLIVPEQDFVSLNGHQTDRDKTIGIMGPGTGLGNSVLYTSPFRDRKRVYVLTSEGGHTDAPYIDDEVLEYIKFFEKNIQVEDIKHISLERSFCGPAIPMMYKFYCQKYPEAEDRLPEHLEGSSKEIIKKCLESEPSVIFAKVFELFMKIYQAAMGNYIAQHMCTGGLILVGSLTNGILPKLQETDLLVEWKKRHIQFAKNIEGVPIVVCKEVDLGLKGAFVMGRRIIADEQHE